MGVDHGARSIASAQVALEVGVRPGVMPGQAVFPAAGLYLKVRCAQTARLVDSVRLLDQVLRVDIAIQCQSTTPSTVYFTNYAVSEPSQSTCDTSSPAVNAP
jgi:hypothetical protein